MTHDSEALRAGDVDLPGWRWLLNSLHGWFAVGSLMEGAELVAAVALAADELGQCPDINLRGGHVQFIVYDREVGGVTRRDVELAQVISGIAADAGLAADVSRLQVLELALDTPAAAEVRPFWAAVLGGDASSGDVVDPQGVIPPLWFQDTDSTAPDRQRFHLDVTVPAEVGEIRIAAAVAAGGRIVDTSHAPAFTVLADADDNLACICTEEGRD